MDIKETGIGREDSIKLECSFGNKTISLGVFYARFDEEYDEYYLVCENAEINYR